jgi:hypothetical protein
MSLSEGQELRSSSTPLKKPRRTVSAYFLRFSERTSLSTQNLRKFSVTNLALFGKRKHRPKLSEQQARSESFQQQDGGKRTPSNSLSLHRISSSEPFIASREDGPSGSVFIPVLSTPPRTVPNPRRSESRHSSSSAVLSFAPLTPSEAHEARVANFKSRPPVPSQLFQGDEMSPVLQHLPNTNNPAILYSNEAVMLDHVEARSSQENRLVFHDIISGHSSLDEAHPEMSYLEQDSGNDSQLVDKGLRIQRLTEAIESLGSQAMQTRSILYEKRVLMRNQRLVLRTVDSNLMRFVRETLKDSLPDVDQSWYLKIIMEVQDARDVYGPMEEEYDEVESRLNIEEWNYRKAVEELSRVIVGSSSFDGDSSSISSIDEYQEDAKDFEYFDEGHSSVYGEFLDRLYQFEEAQRAYNRWKSYRERSQQERRSTTDLSSSMSSSEDDKEGMHSLHQRETEGYIHLQQAKRDLEISRINCLESGLFASTIFENYEFASALSADAIQVNDFNDFSLLHQQSEEDYPETEIQDPIDGYFVFEILSEFEHQDNGGRVCSWMLHMLRSSIYELGILLNISGPWVLTVDDKMNSRMEIDQWQELVLGCWYSDTVLLIGAKGDTPQLTIEQMTLYSHDSPRTVLDGHHLDSPRDREQRSNDEDIHDHKKWNGDWDRTHFEKPP